tara:strand:+ start:213 stop:1091 length:879 start_codon:yes stop_codon:yes gene_type:complete
MKLTKKIHYYLVLHLTIIIWGFTGILGTLISLPSSAIVIDRMLIAYLALASMLLFRKKEFVEKKIRWQMLIVGVITAGHWLTFFESLKVSNVSVTLCCLASCSFFVSLLQPLFNNSKLKPYELVLGLFVILGIYIIFTFESDFSLGIILSLISAFLAAIFSVWNANLIKYNSAFTITLNEMLAGWIAMFLYFSFKDDFDLHQIIPHGIDWLYILVLGVICTAIAFLLGTAVLKELSAFTVSISVNLEPIYGILLALWIFGESEEMSMEFYFGAGIILSTILANAYFKSKETN